MLHPFGTFADPRIINGLDIFICFEVTLGSRIFSNIKRTVWSTIKFDLCRRVVKL